MFKEVDANQEASILAGAERKKRGPDFSIREINHWFTLPHHTAFCSVPSHYDNVPEHDMNGQPYDKYPTRMCVTIEPYEVCRWCFLAEGDVVAALEGLDPVPAGKDENASG